MVNLPLYVVFLVAMVSGAFPLVLFGKDMGREFGEEVNKDFLVGLFVDTAVLCLALWLVSLVWNG